MSIIAILSLLAQSCNSPRASKTLSEIFSVNSPNLKPLKNNLTSENIITLLSGRQINITDASKLSQIVNQLKITEIKPVKIDISVKDKDTLDVI